MAGFRLRLMGRLGVYRDADLSDTVSRMTRAATYLRHRRRTGDAGILGEAGLPHNQASK